MNRSHILCSALFLVLIVPSGYSYLRRTVSRSSVTTSSTSWRENSTRNATFSPEITAQVSRFGSTQRGTVLVSYLHYKTLDSGINKLLSCRCYWNGKLFWLSTPISRLVCFAPRVKTRRAKCPCVYYANTSASFHCLLHGDLLFKLNPGPVNNAGQSASSSNCPRNKSSRRSSAPVCGVCEKAVKRNQKRFLCVICKDLNHVCCAQISNALIKTTCVDSPLSWTCSKCMLSELPFFGQRSLDTSDVIDNGLPVDEDQHLNALEERSQQLKVLHINTQSITSTFDSLLMTIDRYSFDIITMSETWLNENKLRLQHVTIPGSMSKFSITGTKLRAEASGLTSRNQLISKDGLISRSDIPPWSICGSRSKAETSIAISCWV